MNPTVFVELLAIGPCPVAAALPAHGEYRKFRGGAECIRAERGGTGERA